MRLGPTRRTGYGARTNVLFHYSMLMLCVNVINPFSFDNFVAAIFHVLQYYME